MDADSSSKLPATSASAAARRRSSLNAPETSAPWKSSWKSCPCSAASAMVVPAPRPPLPSAPQRPLSEAVAASRRACAGEGGESGQAVGEVTSGGGWVASWPAHEELYARERQ